MFHRANFAQKHGIGAYFTVVLRDQHQFAPYTIPVTPTKNAGNFQLYNNCAIIKQQGRIQRKVVSLYSNDLSQRNGIWCTFSCCSRSETSIRQGTCMSEMLATFSIEKVFYFASG